MPTDDNETMMNNVVTNGNSGIGVGDVDEEDVGDEVEVDGVGDVDGDDELEVASTVPPVTVAVMGSDVPPGA